jgi:PAS domain S-box-containing protein
METASVDPSCGGELRERLAAIVASSDDAIIGKTLGGIVTSWNTGAERMYGYTAAEMVGRNISQLFPADQAGELRPILDRLRHGERIDHYETKRVRKDGVVIDVSISVSPIKNSDGAVTGAATVARDITEHNRAENALLEMMTRLHRSERMEMAGELAGWIAHDFNNLLGAILGYAELIAQDPACKPTVQSDARQIQAAAERASRLTTDLLSFSRRNPGRPETVDLNAVIAGARDLMSASVGSPVDLRLDLARSLPGVVVDEAQLELVLFNLVVNARDAMPAGGAVTIRTGVADLTQHVSRPGPVRPGRYVELVVSDTGLGMRSDVAARIFERFFTTKPPGQGTGLGLATVHRIITQAGGGISVNTAEGAGTAIHVYLPAGAPEAAANGTRAAGRARAAVAAATSGEAATRATIMVVDDEPAVLALTSRILRRDGYATLEARSGEEALSLASSHDFQLLLTDAVMPRMPGPELAGLMREMKPDVRVMYMSGYSRDVLNQEHIAEGELLLVDKPFTAATLLDKVQTALNTTR